MSEFRPVNDARDWIITGLVLVVIVLGTVITKLA